MSQWGSKSIEELDEATLRDAQRWFRRNAPDHEAARTINEAIYHIERANERKEGLIDLLNKITYDMENGIGDEEISKEIKGLGGKIRYCGGDCRDGICDAPVGKCPIGEWK